MVLTALRGAVGFLTRLPVGHDESAWDAFRALPATMPLVGYLVGAVIAIPLVAPLPAPSAAFAFLAILYLLTGITHVDGIADLGDAAVVHGDSSRRIEVMKDSVVGTGGALAVGITLLGLATAALLIAEVSWRALGIVVAAEVGAKASMALLVCFGRPAVDGLGAAVADDANGWTALSVLVVLAPATVLAWPVPLASLAAVLAALTTGALVYAWASRALGGLNGDVLGATNELGRVAALHAGVIVWTLS